MSKRKKTILILDHVETYILARDLCPDYCLSLRARVRKFCVWMGRPATIADLQPKIFNEWLTALQKSTMKANTVEGYRRSLLCIWRDAYESELTDVAPLRIKRLKKPRIVVEAFTHEEIRALIAATDKLTGYLPNGVRRKDLAKLAILLAYCSGLRRGDIFRLKRSQVRSDGAATVIQSKTGYPVKVRLSADAMELAAKIKPDNGDDRVCPWPYTGNRLATMFKQLVKLAGVRDGQFRWLRRSAGSYAESVTPGAGSRLLGHRDERVFRAHYEDTDISQTHIIEPPPIAPPTIAVGGVA
jgi:integrase